MVSPKPMDGRYSGMNAPSTGNPSLDITNTIFDKFKGWSFDNPIIKPIQKPAKRIGIILPNLTNQEGKEGTMSENACSQTINKSILKPQDKCSAHTKMALNLLSSKIFDEDPLA